MSKFLFSFSLVLLITGWLPLTAAAPAPSQPVPDDAPPPPSSTAPPPVTDEQETLEPQVTIIQRAKEIVEEYRINNRLYMVKITPRHGKPYYLIDTNGDGTMESRRDTLDPQLAIPHWVLFRW